MKTMMPSKQKPRSSPATVTYNNKTHTDSKEIANAFNDFFITIGDKTSKGIPAQPDECITAPPTMNPVFKLRNTSIEEVTKAMKAINPNKASDIYKIKPIILRDLTDTLSPILTTLFRRKTEHYLPTTVQYHCSLSLLNHLTQSSTNKS
jgi:hypothetical protein